MFDRYRAPSPAAWLLGVATADIFPLPLSWIYYVAFDVALA